MDTEPTVIDTPAVVAEAAAPAPEEKKEKKKRNSLKNHSNGTNGPDDADLQKLEEKATKAQEAFEREEKLRKELESLNSKLLAEKTALLESLSGEKGQLSEYQEKTAKLTAQKNDLDNQLRVSILEISLYLPHSSVFQKPCGGWWVVWQSANDR